jgi:hypothetical protein
LVEEGSLLGKIQQQVRPCSIKSVCLTNYHIVEDIVNEVSTPEKDLAKEGFVARTRADEIST